MRTDWNLEILYKSCDDPSFLEAIQNLDELIAAFKEKALWIVADEERQAEKLEAYIDLNESLEAVANKLGAFLSLTLSVSSTDTKASKYRAKLYQQLSQLAESDALIEQWIGKLPTIDAVISQSERLQAHAFFFEEIVRHQKYSLSAKEEAIIAQMTNTGSTAWVNYKDQLIATHRVPITVDGVEQHLPLTEVLNLANSSDETIRKTAYEAEIAAYKPIEEGVAAALNGIKGEVLTISEMRGYESVIQMTLENSRMNKETLEAMLGAMREALPVFRNYLKRKATLLGHTKGLPWYDLYAPVVTKEMPFDYEKGKAFVVTQFNTFSKHLGDFAQYAMDNAWMDVYPKSGKVGGAFCASLKPIRESRILLNYGNTLGDVITMAHELGHGFHNACMNKETLLNSSYPMPLAETASTLCETIVKKAAVREASAEEKIAIIENELSDCTQVIVDIYSRYLFETAFFEKRKEGYVSVEEIKELMLDAQREAYGDGLDPDVLHPYMWTWKSHYYRANTNFYNFPYAFGLLFAKGLYAKYEADKEGFPARYEELLAATGKMSIEDVANTININVSDKKFWQDSLQTIIDDIDVFMQLTEEK